MKPDSAELVYEGALISVTRERWGEHEREIVEHPGSVAIVAVDGQSRVVLVRQLREPARRHLLELPAGTLEPDEDALTCARRELAEETGLRGGRWTELASFWTTPGFCRERMTLFCRRGRPGGPRRAGRGRTGRARPLARRRHPPAAARDRRREDADRACCSSDAVTDRFPQPASRVP
jgi:8-oxo-dGTP pyrophosphatase MutT (NUDIX family)